METAAATARPGAARKRLRSQSPPCEGEGPSELKLARLRFDCDGGAKGAWEHLDLVLSLQSKELSLERSHSASVSVNFSS